MFRVVSFSLSRLSAASGESQATAEGQFPTCRQTIEQVGLTAMSSATGEGHGVLAHWNARADAGGDFPSYGVSSATVARPGVCGREERESEAARRLQEGIGGTRIHRREENSDYVSTGLFGRRCERVRGVLLWMIR